jgi:hypothetical protein
MQLFLLSYWNNSALSVFPAYNTKDGAVDLVVCKAPVATVLPVF